MSKPKQTLCFLVALAGALAACASETVRTNYYAWGGGTLVSGSSNRYDWFATNNWRVLDVAGAYVTPACIPQQGDIAIFNKGINYMAGNDGRAMPALWKVDFQTLNCIHQGFVNLLAGGEGLVMADTGDMGWWAGLQLTGTGEVPINVPTGRTFTNQKGVKGTATLVKTGGGKFRTAGEGAGVYAPLVTKLQGGSIWMKSSTVLAGGEFIFDSNDGDLRLVLENFYKNNWYNDWRLNNGALSESASVDNTTHGISTYNTAANAYLRLYGTPKVAEQRFTGQLYNTAGISFAPSAKQADGSDYVFTFAKAVSTAGGGLAVTNGTMKLAESASFQNLKVLNVGPGATFEVAAGSGSCFSCAKLDVAAGGSLKLGTGVTLAFGADASYSGERLAEGTYTADGADGTTQAAWITGAGQVTVYTVPQVSPITLAVAEGDKADLDEALAAWSTAHPDDTVTRTDLDGGSAAARTLVKTGAGTLYMTNAIAGWTGSFYAKAGYVRDGCVNAFGSDTERQAIVVEKGGAIIEEVAAGRTSGYNANQTFYIAGTGPDGAGALRTGSNMLTYGTPNIFGKCVKLTDDATVKHAVWYYITQNLYLNGHTLTLVGFSQGQPFFIDRFCDAGNLVFNGGQERMTTAVIDKPLNITMKNNGGWRLWDSYNTGDGLTATRVTVSGTAQFCCDCSNADGISRTSKNNGIFFPITFEQGASLTCASQNNNYFGSVRFHSALAGPGSLILSDASTPDYVHLFNPANSFTGGATVHRGILYAYAPGTLPAACPVTLNGKDPFVKTGAMQNPPPAYYGLAFTTPDAHTLASLTVSGANARRVQGGLGRWTGAVTKKDAGTCEYYSELGGPLLKVTGGTVKLPRGAAPGLWEGTNLYADATAVASAFAGTATATNHVMRGPHTANAHANENYMAAGATRLMTYSGYVWNRETTNVTWTLASSVNGPVRIEIDGASVLATSAAALQKAQVTLTPGAHAFAYRAYNGSPRATGWAAKCGFMYDALGRDGGTTNTYAYCVDPGDGSLFTRTAGADALPSFDEMNFAAGTALDVNGGAYTAAKISGWPTVKSSAADPSAAPSLAITNAFVVNGAEVQAGRRMTVEMPLSFGETGGVVVTNLATLAHGTYTLATASAPISFGTAGVTRRRLATDSRLWTVALSADRQSVELSFTAGTVLLVR